MLRHVYCVSYAITYYGVEKNKTRIIRLVNPIVTDDQVTSIENDMNAENIGYIIITGINYLGLHHI